MIQQERELVLKTLIVGDLAVGKSSLLERIIYPLKDFNETIAPTIGLEFATHKIFIHHPQHPPQAPQSPPQAPHLHQHDKVVNVSSNRETTPKPLTCVYKLQIWDCAGHPKFYSIVKSYFRGSHIVLYVFDVTNRTSFANLTDWHTAIVQNLDTNYVSVVIGNKIDLSKNRKVSILEAQKFADSINATYMEISAKSSSQIHDIFKAPTHYIDDLYHKGLFTLPKIKDDTVYCTGLSVEEVNEDNNRCKCL